MDHSSSLPLSAAEPTAPRPARPTAESGRDRLLAAARRFVRAPAALPGAIIVLAAVVGAVGAPLLAPYRFEAQDLAHALEGPSPLHPLGTDDLGRDTLSRVLYGARASLQVAAVAVSLAVLVGSGLGLVVGYVGGWADQVAMRLMDGILSFPALVLALGITAALGPGLFNATLAIAVVNVPFFARLARGQVLSVREWEFVEAARALGARPGRIILRHILPNVSGPLIVQATLTSSYAILTEANLSFLGVGVQPPTPSWGSMLRNGYNFLELSPSIVLFPGLAIFLTVLGINFVGEALREVLDPRAAER